MKTCASSETSTLKNEDDTDTFGCVHIYLDMNPGETNPLMGASFKRTWLRGASSTPGGGNYRAGSVVLTTTFYVFAIFNQITDAHTSEFDPGGVFLT